MDRDSSIQGIVEALDGDSLVWYGTRGVDARPLLHVPGFSGVCSLIAPMDRQPSPDWFEVCLEDLSGVRVDLNNYDLDEDRSEAVSRYRRHAVELLRPGTVLIAYRPSDLLSSTYFPQLGAMRYLGNFHAHQAAFEHKPWVETQLAATGISVIPWRYYGDDDLERISEHDPGRKYVVRANRSDGGSGVFPVLEHENLVDHIPQHLEHFVAIAPFLDPSVPLNVAGVVFEDASVTVHSPSLQLIGLPECTRKPFGYCGNDFAAVHALLGDDGSDALEEMVVRVGAWLHRFGYRGTFGLDALWYEDRLVLTEVNPRFQGSSAVSAGLDRRLDLTDVYLEHIRSLLGLSPSPDRPLLREVVKEQACAEHAISQVVMYNTKAPCHRDSRAVVPDIIDAELWAVPRPETLVQEEATMFKVTPHRSVTDSGFTLHQRDRGLLADCKRELFGIDS